MKSYSALIIDDDVWMQRILSKTLESYGFKKSFLASNGFDGLDLAVAFKPDLIVLDILMPDLSGHMTLRILKSMRLTKNIPVIMVSALSDAKNLGKAVKTGTAGFISKPFTRATVFEKLLDIYGKDKLEKIARGEEFEEVEPEKITEKLQEMDATASIIKSKLTPKVPKSEPKEIAKHSESSRAAFNQDKLLQHYQDDERKSLETIKKLLLKNKK